MGTGENVEQDTVEQAEKLGPKWSLRRLSDSFILGEESRSRLVGGGVSGF